MMGQVGIPLGYGQDAAAIYNYLYQNYFESKQYFYDNFDADIYPALPDGMDDEFENGHFSGNWTIINNPLPPNSLSVHKFPGFLWVGLPHSIPQSYPDWVHCYQAPPPWDIAWEVIIKASINVEDWTTATVGGDYTAVCLVLSDSVGPRYLGINMEHRYIWESACSIYAVQGFSLMSSATVFAKNDFVSGSLNRFIYLKLKKTTLLAYTSNNTYKVYFSLNGILWYLVGYHTMAFVNAPNRFGLVFRFPLQDLPNAQGYAMVDFFRRIN